MSTRYIVIATDDRAENPEAIADDLAEMLGRAGVLRLVTVVLEDSPEHATLLSAFPTDFEFEDEDDEFEDEDDEFEDEDDEE